MKLIEGMKQLRIIEKKMLRNSGDIARYASMLDTERPYFESEDRQREEIKNLEKSNIHLFGRYLKLKQAVEKTNLEVQVKICNKTFTISELLVIKRRLGALMLETYNSMHDTSAENKRRFSKVSQEKTPGVVRYYSEEEKMGKLREWHELIEEIDSRLEVINATTPLSGFEDTETGG